MAASTSTGPAPLPAAGMRPVLAYLAKGLLYKLFLLALFLIAAGRWDWLPAWIYVGIFFAYDLATVAFVYPRSPDLLTERSTRHKDIKSWDKAIMGLSAGLLPMIAGVVAGLDERWRWAPEVSPTVQWIAGIVVALGYAIVVWSMWANAYFSAVVRIQTDRGHSVATGGPYRMVRHPGYVGAILFTLAMPVLMGSLWGLIPAALAAILFIVRTRLEDDTLQAELPGYTEFTQQTRYRLLPGIW